MLWKCIQNDSRKRQKPKTNFVPHNGLKKEREKIRETKIVCTLLKSMFHEFFSLLIDR